MQEKPEFSREVMPYGLFCFVQHTFFMVEQHHVIDVTDVPFDAQFLFDKVVERRQIQVGEKLAGKVAHRQPFSPFLEGK